MLHAPAGSKGKILIADDDSSIRKTRDMLQAWGIDADMASTGLEVLNRVRTNSYDMVLMNTELTGMSGAIALRILRTDTRFQTLPVVACPASSELSTEELVQSGFSAVLAKPFVLKDLEAELRRFLPPESFLLKHAIRSADAQTTPAPSSPVTQQPVSIPTPVSTPNHAPVLDIAEILAGLPGFDCAKGLHRVMGNLGLYTKLLVNFKQALEESSREMDQALEQGIDAVRALVHKLKGISGNLGAEQLYMQTLDIEALLRQQDLKSSLEELDIFMTSVQKTWDELDALPFLSPQKPVASVPSTVAPQGAEFPVAGKEMLAALDETASLLQQCDTASRESFDRLVLFFGDSRNTELSVIKNAIDSFDFELAEKSLATFARTLRA